MSATVPEVSVVIPHYGDPIRVVALLDRLREQQRVRIECIVADDASPIPMPDVAGATVVRRERNGGFGATVNTGAGQARAPYVLILNSDLEIDDTFVSDLLEASKPWQPAVTAPAIVGLDGETQWSGRRFPTALQQTIEWLTPLARFRSTDWWHRAVGHDLDARPGRVVPVDWLVGAVLLIPTELFREARGFDERFHMNAEEVDLQRRLARLGVPRVYLGVVEARHEGGGSSADSRRRQWLVTARIRYAKKWGGDGAARRLRAALAIASAVNLAINSVRRLLGSKVGTMETFHYELTLLRRSAR